MRDLTPEHGTKRSAEVAFKAWEQACRQRWRALHRRPRNLGGNR